MKTIVKITLFLFVINSFQSCSKDDAPTPEPVAQQEDNEAPVVTTQIFTVAENIADNSPIGTVEASDPEGDTLSYSISANDNNLFEINDEGLLRLGNLQSLDFETTNSHTIIVTVNDGTSTTEALVTINVTDIEDTSFVTTWQTTTTGETVIIPTRADEFSYDYTIDWGDGTIQTGVTGDANHPYDSPGTYTVSISGTFAAIVLGVNTTSQEQLRSVELWGIIQWQTMEAAFLGVNTLAINAIDAPDLSQTISTRAMFATTTNISGNFNTWNVVNVTDMTGMFSNSKFNQDIDISDWDVSNVTNMAGMFNKSEFNQDISGWNVGNVTDMSFMFSESEFNQDIGDWNVGSVENMSLMFNESDFNQDISRWDVRSMNNMGGMFRASKFNQDISDWNVSSVSEMQAMFLGSVFNQDISGWNVANVTSCSNFAFNASLTAANTPNFTNCNP